MFSWNTLCSWNQIIVNRQRFGTPTRRHHMHFAHTSPHCRQLHSISTGWLQLLQTRKTWKRSKWKISILSTVPNMVIKQYVKWVYAVDCSEVTLGISCRLNWVSSDTQRCGNVLRNQRLLKHVHIVGIVIGILFKIHPVWRVMNTFIRVGCTQPFESVLQTCYGKYTANRTRKYWNLMEDWNFNFSSQTIEAWRDEETKAHR